MLSVAQKKMNKQTIEYSSDELVNSPGHNLWIQY